MLKGLHHIAIAVNNLDETAKWYQDMLGLPAPEVEETVAEQGVRACLINLGNCYLELLEPTSETSTVARFLAREGEKLHHICLESDDVAGDLRTCASKGLDLIDKTPRHGIAGMIGFLHPRSTRGVLIEFVQTLAAGAGH